MKSSGKSFVTSNLHTSDFIENDSKGIRFVENVEYEFIVIEGADIDSNV